MKNKSSTRAFSDIHEKSVCEALNAKQCVNSGAGLWQKGDCLNQDASLLIECKTSMSDKDSFSVKKEWLETLRKNSYQMRLSNCCLAFNFGPNQKSYYIIDESLAKFLIDKLQDEERNS